MFVFYKPDGEISYTIEGRELPRDLKTNGLSVIEVETIAPDLHMLYVEDGAVLRKPAQLGDWAVWDSTSKSWIDPRNDEEKILAAKQAVKDRRDKAIEAGTTVNGVLMPTDPTSRDMITGAALSAMLDPNYTANWKMPGGSFMLLDATQIIGIASAIRAHVQACFDRENALNSAIAAGDTYDLEAGWPT